MNPADYQSYKGLPSLAGICTLPEAIKPGLSVEACVAHLKRAHYAFRRLHEIFTARITAEPIYELKMAFSLHAHLCVEQVAAIRKRVSEMREPPLGLEDSMDPFLKMFFDEILNAPTTEELVLGLYDQAIPALIEALQRHIDATHPLADQPSVRVCRFGLVDLADISGFGDKAVECLAAGEARLKAASWLGLLKNCLAAAGGLHGDLEPAEGPLTPIYSARPYRYDGIPKRDERFTDPYNMGVNAETFLYDDRYPPSAKVPMMYYKRLREIDVPEMMASIITETPGKPWNYYRDMTRQLWDEARHAMMGEVGFVSLGVDWRKVKVNFTWALGLNTQLKPIERHGVLYFIERGLMPATGKRFEWEVAVASHNRLSALFQDFDWADEVLHSNIGRDWYVTEFGSTQEAIDYGDRCWSRVLADWAAWRDQGLTEHRNWWPDVYTEVCSRTGTAPDPDVLSYSTTYEGKRADLKAVMVSG